VKGDKVAQFPFPAPMRHPSDSD